MTQTDSYTVFEFDNKTKKYNHIGFIDAENAKQATEKFEKTYEWKSNGNTILFAKPPLCR